MHRNQFAGGKLSLLAMVLAGLMMQSCSPGMTAEQKSSWEAVQFLTSTLGRMPFSGATTFLTSPLEGGQAVVFYPGADSSRSAPDQYYAFWIYEKTVYAVNHEASAAYPKLPQSPPTVSMNAVIAAIDAEEGITLKPEAETPAQ